MNVTIEKFGYPGTLVSEYDHWVVLLRPQQATLGALILACKEDAEAFGDISAEATREMSRVVRDIESTLGSAFGYDKINYLMLMMVDPNVHFHVLPRYAATTRFGTSDFDDPGWPGPPRLDHAATLAAGDFEALREHLLDAWPEVGR